MAKSFRSSRSGAKKSTGETPARIAPTKRPTAARLVFEALECRFNPATYVWTGASTASGAALWSDAANWQGNVAPTGNPADSEDLVFGGSAIAARRATTNDLPLFSGAAPVFNSFTFSADGYTLDGTRQAALGTNLTNSGNIILSNSNTNVVINFPIQLTSSPGSNQVFDVNAAGSNLTLNGALSGSTGSVIVKRGLGNVNLTTDNSGFTGLINVENSGGTLTISNANALGSTNAATTIGSNAQLIVNNVTGPINEPLILTGLGLSNTGNLLNLAGNNIWSGPINLTQNSAIGATANGNLTITGVISDAGSGFNLVKEGVGEVILSASNFYRGLTIINDGTLTVTNKNSLGQETDPTQQGTIVNQSVTKSGQLKIAAPANPDGSAGSLTILNEQLTLNGVGRSASGANNGALYNAAGNNIWASGIAIGSLAPNGVSVNIGVNAATSLNVTGVVSSPNDAGGSYSLTKIGTGKLIFSSGNSYTGFTTIAAGILTIRDSMGLGSTGQGTSVSSGASLEYEVEAGDLSLPRFDPHGRDLYIDSVLGNNPNSLQVSENLTLRGRGFGSAGVNTGIGALHSKSGINTQLGTITLSNVEESGIGVDTDSRPGFPSADSGYLTNDYSLTVKGTIQDLIDGSRDYNNFRRSGSVITTIRTLVKRGFGNLILNPTLGISDNTYTGQTIIEQGWITARTDNAIGAPLVNDPRYFNERTSQPNGLFDLYVGGTQTSPISISAGAALHLWPDVANLASVGQPNFINVSHNLILNGVGIDLSPTQYPFGFIAKKGAVMSLAGDNVLTGNIQFNGPVGIGVESLDPTNPAELSIQNTMTDFTASSPGSWIKLGSGRLDLQSSGTYSGDNIVQEGTVRVQHGQALGYATSGTLTTQQVVTNTNTTVKSGAILQIDDSVASLNGGIASGIQIWNENLGLESPGQQIAVSGRAGTFTLAFGNGGVNTTVALPFDATASMVQNALNQLDTIRTPNGPGSNGSVTVTQNGNVFTVLFLGDLATPSRRNPAIIATAGAPVGGQNVTLSVMGSDINPGPGAATNSPLMVLAGATNAGTDAAWRGGVTLAGNSRIGVAPNSRFSIFGVLSDTSPDDLVKRDLGALTLAGANTFRGSLYVTEGLVTAMNSQAFGAVSGGVIVSSNSGQLQIEGNLTFPGESLTIAGNGLTPGAAPTNVPVRWFELGPNGINNGASPNSMPTSGTVTATAVDPSDPNVIYIATAGGGAWKTKDGGKTWNSLFDLATFNGMPAVMWGGAIAVSQSNPNVIYYGTGVPDANYYYANNAGTNPTVGVKPSYDAFAGTGVYRSNDAGQTWQLVVNSDGVTNPIYGSAVTAIVVDAFDPNLVYVATATDKVVFTSTTAVPGVYRFNGAIGAVNWFDLTGVESSYRTGLTPGPDDDFRLTFPQTVGAWTDLKIAYIDTSLDFYRGDPTQGSFFRRPRTYQRVVYAALGTSTVQSFGGDVNFTGSNGVYRLADMNEPGFQFPTNTTSNDPHWTVGTGGLNFATSATAPEQVGTFTPNTVANAFPNADTFATSPPPWFPRPQNGPIKIALFEADNPSSPNFNTSFINNNPIGSQFNNPTIYLSRYDDLTIYAAVSYPQYRAGSPFVPNNNEPFGGQLRYILRAAAGQYAGGWQDVTGNLPNLFTQQNNIPNNVPPSYGQYDNAIVAVGPSNVIVGGYDQVFESTNANSGSSTWSTISTDTGGNGPGNSIHSLMTDSTRSTLSLPFTDATRSRPSAGVLASSDTGLWRLDVTQVNLGSFTPSWTDLNGNLGITQVYGVDVNPNDLNGAVAATSKNGIVSYNGSNVWTMLDSGTAAETYIDPANPSVIYQAQVVWDPTAQTNSLATFNNGRAGRNGVIRRSTDGGATWTTLNSLPINYGLIPNNPNGNFNQFSSPFDSAVNFAFVLDPVANQSGNRRLLVGGQGVPVFDSNTNQFVLRNPRNVANQPGTTAFGLPLQESLDGGNTWVSLKAPIAASEVAIATYQGTFVADTGFPLVGDKLSNTYDPDTIYISDGTNFVMTKNHGVVWTTRNIPGMVGNIVGMTVDPSNRDTVYVVTNGATGTNTRHVYQTTTAGRLWQDITGVGFAGASTGSVGTATTPGNLPDVPTNQITVDPRDGTLYAATDNGVWRRTVADDAWRPFGQGMDQFPVRQIVLNQSLNTLTAATYGRGVFQLYLNDVTANSGALRVASGATNWTGPVFLSGNTQIQVAGSQAVQNGISAASFNVIGSVQDLTTTAPGSTTLTKSGLGNLILSGNNNYSAVTDVTQGILTVSNPNALGNSNPVANTIIENGAVIQLQSDLAAEPITLNGGGFQFNSHYTGAMRNIANNNTYTGTLTLGTGVPIFNDIPIQVASGVVIGVDAGTQLTIGQKSGLAGNGVVQDPNGGSTAGLIKEQTGTLVLSGNNTYAGETDIIQGALRAQNNSALGSIAAGTRVFDGAALEMASSVAPNGTLVPTVINGESLSLTGTGIQNTGAIRNFGGLDSLGNILPAGNNAFNGPILLTNADNGFSPTTTPPLAPAVGSALYDPNGGENLTLGGVISQPIIRNFGLNKVGPGRVTLGNANTYGGPTQIQQGALQLTNNLGLGSPNPPVQVLTVTGTSGGFTLTFNGVATTTLAFNATSTQVQTALNALSTISGAGGFVTVTQVAFPGGSLPGNQPGFVYTIEFGGSLATGPINPLLVTATGGTTASLVTGTVVSNGAALELNGTAASLSVDEPLFLNGMGIQNAGALRNFAGNNTYTGPITLSSNTAIGADPNTTLNLNRAGGSLYDPQVLPPLVGPVNAAELHKVGGGTVTLLNDNPYIGKTLVDNGVLDMRSPQALGTTAANQQEVQQVSVLGSNGFFNLTFNGTTDTPSSGPNNSTPLPPNAGALLYNATAQQVQDALNAVLNTVSPGASVAVTRAPIAGGFAYTITFQGTLSGRNVNQLTSTSVSGNSTLIATLQDGPDYTQVNNGGTLQLNNNISVSSEVLILNGLGYNNQGALAGGSGTTTWNRQIVLGSNASVGANLGATLNLPQNITDLGANYGLVKQGQGTVLLDSNVANTYTGTTQVNDGTLLLNKTPGVNAIAGPLVIGDNVGTPNSAIARWLAIDQLPDNTPVTVNSDGLLDLNGQADIIGPLTINNGTATTGANGTLILTAVAPSTTVLTMNSGTLNAGTGGQVVLNGDVAATSSTAGGTPQITGPGPLSLNGATRTFNVSDGPLPTDLLVSTSIIGTGTEGIIKTGAGRMELAVANTYVGPTEIDAGDLQVDNSITSAVQLNGGSVSGIGNLGPIIGTNGAAIGSVAPGYNGTNNPIGILTTNGNSAWGTQTNFNVDLTPGTSDLLKVNGNLDLGGANLVGNLAPGVLLGDTFTLITATNGAITGKFSAPNDTVYLTGLKFQIKYTPTSVTLTRVLNGVTFSITPAANPSVFGQPIGFNITLTAEAGSRGLNGTPPVNSNVTISFAGGSQVTLPLVVDQTTGVGTVQFTPGSQPLAVGNYNLTVSYAGDLTGPVNSPNQIFAPTSATLTQIVNKAATSISVAAGATATVFGQPNTATASLSVTSPGAGTPSGGATILVINSSGQTVATIPATIGSAVSLPLLPVGNYLLRASYAGDASFLASTSSDVAISVAKSGSTTNVQVAPPATNYGETRTFTVNVTATAPGSGTPAGTVTVFDGNPSANVIIGTGALTNGQATFSTNALASGTHTINVIYTGDGSFLNSSSAPLSVTINRATTALTIASSAATYQISQPVTVTATLTGNFGPLSPTGVISFNNNGINLGTAPITFTSSGATATLVIPADTFVLGSQTVFATYGGDTNYLASSTSGGATFDIIPNVPPPPPPPPGTIAVGAGVDFDPVVNLYNPDGSLRISLRAFTEQYSGGVRTAVADFNKDGFPDIVVGTGPGTTAHVRIINGKDNNSILFDLMPFNDFTGGVFVGTGDVNNDGVPDIVITPDEGGGPRVRIFNGKDFTQINDFFGINDPNFRGGARASIGDVNGDGFGEVVVSAGFGGGPRIATFDGKSVASGSPTPKPLFGDFFAFEDTLRNGAYVTVGDVNGDGNADLIIGAGPGGGPRVSIFNGKDLLNNQYNRIGDFFAGNENNRGGVRVAYKTYQDGSTAPDIVTGSGVGDGDFVYAFPAASTILSGNPAARFSFEAYNDALGGVYVG